MKNQVVINFPSKSDMQRFLQRVNTVGIIIGDNDRLYFGYDQVIDEPRPSEENGFTTRPTAVTFVRKPPGDDLLHLDVQKHTWATTVRVLLDGKPVEGVVEAQEAPYGEQGWIRCQDRDQMFVKRGKVEVVPTRGTRAHLLAWYYNDPHLECMIAADWVATALQDTFPALSDADRLKFQMALTKITHTYIKPTWDCFATKSYQIGTGFGFPIESYDLIEKALIEADIKLDVDDVYSDMTFTVHISPGYIWVEGDHTDIITIYGGRI